jgi:hypothetical protein
MCLAWRFFAGKGSWSPRGNSAATAVPLAGGGGRVPGKAQAYHEMTVSFYHVKNLLTEYLYMK